MKRVILFIMLLGVMAATFYVGMITGRLRQAAVADSGYPEDLHRLLSEDTFGCDLLEGRTNFGPYRVDLHGNGNLLRVISYDPKRKTLAGSLLDIRQRQAVMTWEGACQEEVTLRRE